MLTALSLALALAGSRGAGPPVDATRVLDEWVGITETLVVGAAEALPEEAYAFAPKDGAFDGVRTFAEQVKHLAAANHQLGARALGEEPPAGTHDEEAPASVRSREEILAYLRASFARLHRAAGSTTTSNLVDPISGTTGSWQRTRLGLLVDALAHSQNHYGQMVEYLRMNGVVPPASR